MILSATVIIGLMGALGANAECNDSVNLGEQRRKWQWVQWGFMAEVFLVVAKAML